MLYLLKMNYYDETIEKIKEYIDCNDFLSAKAIILEELKQVYIPADFEKSLYSYLSIINDNLNTNKTYSINDIEAFLMQDEQHQLIAVDYLDKLNLRDHIDICDSYLRQGSYKNGKVLLIDSLIRQQVDHEFTYIDDNNTYNFNPIKIPKIEESDIYKYIYNVLNDYYMKEPSKLMLAIQLLNKEMLLSLPNIIDIQYGNDIADKIINYIDSAFDSAN